MSRIKIENGEFISAKNIIGRNSSLPAGSEYANIEINSDNGKFTFERLYIHDDFNLESKSSFEIKQKFGKSLLIPSPLSEKDALKSFKEYYTYHSIDAFKLLYFPLILICLFFYLFDKDFMIIYMVLSVISFIMRSFTIKKVGNFFLCLIVPTYIYLLFKYSRF